MPAIRREPSPGRRFPPWCAAIVALAIIAVLNVIPGQRGSLVFQEETYTEAFEASRGWPVKSWARCNEGGVELIRHSVVQGDGKYVRDVFPGSDYPHLAYDGFTIIADAYFAALLAWAAFVVTKRMQ